MGDGGKIGNKNKLIITEIFPSVQVNVEKITFGLNR